MPVETMFSLTEQLSTIGISPNAHVYYQQTPQQLIEQTLHRHQGTLSDTGALVINTGKFTGRSPQDRFIVLDSVTRNAVNWNTINQPINEAYFSRLQQKMVAYFNYSNEFWVRDAFACADTRYRLNIRVITQKPWSSLFAYNMFLRPTRQDLDTFEPEWMVLQAEDVLADPQTEGTRKENFTIISFAHKTILIGGSGYTGEIKKSIFSVLNFVLPYYHNLLSMHCSANVGNEGDTAIFFGLSGTGKTTLSSDPDRKLIGDDEHGWANNSVFNFEGGCYAKTIGLQKENEPGIFSAIRQGALVENTVFMPGSNHINFNDSSITENTRVSYPLSFINNAIEPSVAGVPTNVFFLTCDAAGVLPPISRLTVGQAMYQFMSGYTAKVAGTEEGIKEPKLTFSACFGEPFMPLHPAFYAKMLGKKLADQQVQVWLVNTGWSGGTYGIGSRIKLAYTRAMINAALRGQLHQVDFATHPVFGFRFPLSCPGVPAKILNPRNTWKDKAAYDVMAKTLGLQFINTFEKFSNGASAEILEAAPNI